MSVSEDNVRLRHMLDAARQVKEFVQGRKREDLDADTKLELALVRLLEIIGEAAKAISTTFRDCHPEISWRDIAGTRNRLIHGYFDVDLNIIWQITTKDIPVLITQLEKVIAHER